MRRTHPFQPVIFPNTTKLLVGSLPPEGVNFYFSNSRQNRLWDILKALDAGQSSIDSGGWKWDRQTKIDLLNSLNLGIADIILEYERTDWESVEDANIVPYWYRDLRTLLKGTKIDHILFLYQSAANWFNHSLEDVSPVKVIEQKIDIGVYDTIEVNGRKIKLVLLPMPLNRGAKGETLDFKLRYYRKFMGK